MARILHSSIFFFLILIIGAADHLLYSNLIKASTIEQRTEEDTREGEEIRITHSESKVVKVKKVYPTRFISTPDITQVTHYQRPTVILLLFLTLRVIRI